MSRPVAPRSPAVSSARWLGAAPYAAFASSATTAHRLATSAGGWVERFGEEVLISYKDEAARESLLAGLRVWSAEHSFTPRRVFGKFLPRQNADRLAPALLEGDASLPLTTIVEENGMRFGLDFGAGYSAGLFIDQRANRARLRRLLAKDRHESSPRVLNTFAYTCAFSVAAALAGAETVSIDLSKKSLDRGRENFALNGLDPAAHRFLADDVLETLPRLARQGAKFDAVILDPPTFSRGHKGRRFQVEEDFEALLLAALEVAAQRAHILLSTNCLRLNRRALEAIARFTLKATRRAADFHAEPPLPDIPGDAAAQTLWLQLR